MVLLNTGQLAEGTEDGRRSLAMARDLGDPAAEVLALSALGIAALYSGDNDGAIELIRRQQQITGRARRIARSGSTVLIAALIGAGDLAAAESACAAALARCRDAGDMTNLASLLSLTADLDVQAGRFQDAAAHLREALQVVDADRRFVGDRQRPVDLRVAVRRDRAVCRSRHAVGRRRRPLPAAGARRPDAAMRPAGSKQR